MRKEFDYIYREKYVLKQLNCFSARGPQMRKDNIRNLSVN